MSHEKYRRHSSTVKVVELVYLSVSRLKYYYDRLLRRNPVRSDRYSAGPHPSFPSPVGEGTVLYRKAKQYNYHIGIIPLLTIFGKFLFVQPLRKARAVFRWPSPSEKVGMRPYHIDIGSLLSTLGKSLFVQPFRKAGAVRWWPSPSGKVGMGFLLLFLSSCKVGKEYQRPELELPAQFNAVSFSDTSSIADMDWKKFFTDTTLLGLIENGIKYNHDLLMAIKRIDIAQQQVKQAKALQLPELDLRVAGSISRPSDNSLTGISLKSFLGKSYVENYSSSINLSWEADIWGKLRGQKEVALTQYLQTYEGAKAVQTQLVANIAQGFFNLLMLDKQLEIARKNLLLSDSFLTATRLLKDAGIGNALGVQQAESQKQSTALLIPQFEQN
ncbi:MAG: TolC family protein, partial [Chitinophagaceae bacterium]